MKRTQRGDAVKRATVNPQIVFYLRNISVLYSLRTDLVSFSFLGWLWFSWTLRFYSPSLFPFAAFPPQPSAEVPCSNSMFFSSPLISCANWKYTHKKKQVVGFALFVLILCVIHRHYYGWFYGASTQVGEKCSLWVINSFTKETFPIKTSQRVLFKWGPNEVMLSIVSQKKQRLKKRKQICTSQFFFSSLLFHKSSYVHNCVSSSSSSSYISKMLLTHWYVCMILYQGLLLFKEILQTYTVFRAVNYMTVLWLNTSMLVLISHSLPNV